MTHYIVLMRIDSLLSARLFMAPQLVAGRLYFVSDLSGRLSLYVMEARPGGSVPEPLLPPGIALQHPHHVGGRLFKVLPELGKIVLMLDHDGDENYQPMFLPITGGYPEPVFGDQLCNTRARLGRVDAKRHWAYLGVESRTEAMITTYRADLVSGALTEIARSEWGFFADGYTPDHSAVLLGQGYTAGDNVLFIAENGAAPRPIYGTPLEQREAGKSYPLTGLNTALFTSAQGVLVSTAVFDDAYSYGFLRLDQPGVLHPVTVKGIKHTGTGEFEGFDHLRDQRYVAQYNIDGCAWLYEGEFDEAALTMTYRAVICGQGALSHGVLEAFDYEAASDTFTLSFSTAISPTQLYTVKGKTRRTLTHHTHERVLGVPVEWLAPGEDASFTSHDGLRTSARLYRPAPGLGFSGPRPLIYYVHGGPQSQERPDFAWFSMPLIQFLTLNGFAVFVPNARGSTGYGLSYMKRIDRDWGGQDRLDHVHALTQVLPNDPQVDVKRAAVIGRSYGGYMALTLAARHPELWAAAVDMFGPYNLITFAERLPATWKPYFRIALGDPETDRDFLLERSPSTYIEQVTCPMLVLQGQNDPRVVEPESRDLVEQLRAQNKTVAYHVFENEGHDVLKYDNKVLCYNKIAEFFKQSLKP
jgi:pimeloyl-ACP methyl ester carboxylesterase